MKWIRYILILIIIYIVCSARTCNENEEPSEREAEEYTRNLMDNVKHVFTSDSLSDHLLRAYEIAATEKLIDFADYMKIISDTTLDRKFSQHAAELVRDLFISEEVVISGWKKSYPDQGINNLEHLISYSLFNGVSFWIKPMQFVVIKPFTSLNDSTFNGRISCDYKSFPLNSQDTSEVASGTLAADIYLKKRTRYFGNEKIRVWDVYLGDIN